MSGISLQHVNLTVDVGTLHLADEFYGEVLGFARDPEPVEQREILRWYRVGDGPQQIHVAFEKIPTFPKPQPWSSRHPCFALPNRAALEDLQKRIYEHKLKGRLAAAKECDAPGESSGPKGPEYPARFFARDFAGNLLEFSSPGTPGTA